MLRSVLLIAVLSLVGCQSKPQPEVTQPEVKQTNAKQPQTSAPAPDQSTATVSNGEPPDTILIESPYGNVTFTHKKHYERVNGDCTKCHPKIFPQSRAPLNYKKALHRAAEASMTSCAYCHSIGNSAFAADSNCTKCHALREH